jgi:MinD-like ATPase involved in chromosome partitioning or flagellar assembly
MNELITRFVTFYSYKGGVGRTSALVNVAVQQALRGNNVIILDFDLEAPGTYPYLKKLDPNYDGNREGILEYLVASIEGRKLPDLRSEAIDLSSYLGTNNGGHLWVINAGNTQSASYTSGLEKLRWSEIFQNQFGELLLKNFRNQIIEEFSRPDFVFIDSRTGITETGGVCTRYLADTIVILTSLNEQNINGTGMIFKELASEGKETILVAANVPVGMPTMPDQLFNKRIESFERVFKRAPDVFIYYYPVLSLSEEVPVLHLRKEISTASTASHLVRTDPLIQSYRSLVEAIDRPRPDRIAFLPTVRTAVRALRSYTAEQRLDSLNLLVQYYSERLLAQIVIDAFEFKQTYLANAREPQKWDSDFYQRLVSEIKSVTNSSVQEIIEILEESMGKLLIEYLEDGGKMDSSFEAFFTKADELDNIVLQQISKKQFDWTTGYLRRLLQERIDNPPASIACDLYNLAHCLSAKGNLKEAKPLLLRFAEQFNKVPIDNFPAVTRVNFYFAAALAYKQLGRLNEAREMRQRAQDNLVTLKPRTHVFSPITYSRVPAKDIQEQLDTVFPEDR